MTGNERDTAACIFCKIARDEAPAEILFGSEQALASLDVRPVQYGHALVIPREHYRDLLSVPSGELREVMHAAQVVAGALVRALNIEGFNLFSNNGSVAGQTVYHFHLHVVPRHAGDAIRLPLQLRSYPAGAMAEYGARIRKQIHA